MLNTLAFLQGQELWIILIVVLVLFGGKKIPELMRGVGKGVGELQKGIEEGKRSMDRENYQGSDPEPPKAMSKGDEKPKADE